MENNEFDLTLYPLFKKQVVSYPNKTAVIEGEIRVTFKELEKYALTVAAKMNHVQIQPGKHIAVLLTKGISIIASILGILKIGAVYIPIDPDYPAERVKLILNSEKITGLICKNINALRKLGLSVPNTINIIYLDALDKKKKYFEFNSAYIARSSDPACVMYTSGSAGQPKGVLISHQGIVRLACHPNYIKITSQDVFSQIANCCFDGSIFEIWGALLNGASLVIVKKNELYNYTQFRDLVDKHNISIVFLTPALLDLYAEVPEIFFGVNYLVVGGDILNPVSVNKFFSYKKSPKYIINGYGPTENTTFSLTYQITSKVPCDQLIPIGRPINQTSVFILDRDLLPVKQGEIGEIFLSGKGLLIEYLHATSKDNERLVELMVGLNRIRAYQTGDFGYEREDREIVFIGRKDDQVKRKGFRITLSEITAILNVHPDIKWTATKIIQFENSCYLVSFILPKSNRASYLNKKKIIKWLLGRAPDYLLPDDFIIIKKTPLTNNAKIDESKLINIFLDYKKKTPIHLEKKMDILTLILDLISESIHVPVSNPKKNFFDLGLTSISLMSLISKLNEEIGHMVVLKFIDMIAYPNPLALSNFILSQCKAAENG